MLNEEHYQRLKVGLKAALEAEEQAERAIRAGMPLEGKLETIRAQRSKIEAMLREFFPNR
jgi:hypothetical protein